MKTATILIRTLLGLLFLAASLSFFFHLAPEKEVAGNFKAFNIGLMASTYLIPLAKSVELLCGLAFVIGKYVSLACILIMPITVNILFIHYFLDPSGLPLAIVIFLANIFLIYRYWDNYKSVFTP